MNTNTAINRYKGTLSPSTKFMFHMKQLSNNKTGYELSVQFRTSNFKLLVARFLWKKNSYNSYLKTSFCHMSI